MERGPKFDQRLPRELVEVSGRICDAKLDADKPDHAGKGTPTRIPTRIGRIGGRPGPSSWGKLVNADHCRSGAVPASATRFRRTLERA